MEITAKPGNMLLCVEDIYTKLYEERLCNMKAKQVMELMNLPRTDAGNAERLRLYFKNTWKYLPQYKSWMRWDGHRWEGRNTLELNRFVAQAFRQMALEIYRLPVPADDVAEQHRRVRIIAWLTRSQINYHTMLAVRYFKEMCREDAA